MTMPKKHSRKIRIVVDDIEYRWAYSETWEEEYDALGLSLIVEIVGEVKARIIGRTRIPGSAVAHPRESGVVLQPRHVAAFIKRSRDAGWSPETNRHVTYVDFLCEIINATRSN